MSDESTIGDLVQGLASRAAITPVVTLRSNVFPPLQVRYGEPARNADGQPKGAIGQLLVSLVQPELSVAITPQVAPVVIAPAGSPKSWGWVASLVLFALGVAGGIAIVRRF